MHRLTLAAPKQTRPFWLPRPTNDFDARLLDWNGVLACVYASERHAGHTHVCDAVKIMATSSEACNRSIKKALHAPHLIIRRGRPAPPHSGAQAAQRCKPRGKYPLPAGVSVHQGPHPAFPTKICGTTVQMTTPLFRGYFFSILHHLLSCTRRANGAGFSESTL